MDPSPAPRSLYAFHSRTSRKTRYGQLNTTATATLLPRPDLEISKLSIMTYPAGKSLSKNEAHWSCEPQFDLGNWQQLFTDLRHANTRPVGFGHGNPPGSKSTLLLDFG